MFVRVTATPRPDVPGVWTPGRLWRSEAPTEIEVLDEEDDPQAPEGYQAHPTVIGRKTLARLQREPLLKVEAVDGEALARAEVDNGELEALRAEVDALKIENAELRAQLEVATAPQPKPEKKSK